MTIAPPRATWPSRVSATPLRSSSSPPIRMWPIPYASADTSTRPVPMVVMVFGRTPDRISRCHQRIDRGVERLLQRTQQLHVVPVLGRACPGPIPGPAAGRKDNRQNGLGQGSGVRRTEVGRALPSACERSQATSVRQERSRATTITSARRGTGSSRQLGCVAAIGLFRIEQSRPPATGTARARPPSRTIAPARCRRRSPPAAARSAGQPVEVAPESRRTRSAWTARTAARRWTAVTVGS